MTKYDATASSYDELYTLEQKEKYKVLEGELLKVRGGGAVLDAGCGTGLLIEHLAAVGLRPGYYVGVDISSGMLKRARLRLSRSEVPGDLVQGDIEYMPFRGECFDYTLSITVMDNLYDASKALEELERVTRRGGMISVSRLKAGGRLSEKTFSGYKQLVVPKGCKDYIYSRRRPHHP